MAVRGLGQAEMSHQSSEMLYVYNTCCMHNNRSITWRTNKSFQLILPFPHENPIIASFKRMLYIWWTIQPGLHKTVQLCFCFNVSPIMIKQRAVLMASTHITDRGLNLHTNFLLNRDRLNGRYVCRIIIKISMHFQAVWFESGSVRALAEPLG